jgi:hypothetical protein
VSQDRVYFSRRRPRARWTTLDWAASLSISAFWHLLVLAVMVLAVRPFQLPDVNRPVDLQLLPPLNPPAVPSVDIELRPRQEEPAPKPRPQTVPELRPVTPEPPLPPLQQVQPPQPAPPEPQPLEQTRPSESALANPVEIQKRAAQIQRLQTRQAVPKVQALPPEPVTVTRPDTVLAPPIEAPRMEAPRRAAPLDTSRAAPQVTQEAPAETEAPVSTAPPVLTNDTVIQSPVEIRSRAPAPAVRNLTTQGAAPQITGPPPGGAAAPSGEAGAPAAGGRPGASKLAPGSLEAFKTVPALRGGMGTNFGCADPDAYRLTPEQREACLGKFAKAAKQGPDLGLNIPARKQAEYDHDVACHKAYTLAAIPGSNEASRGTGIPGMGSGPTLKECGPGER